MLCTIIYLSFCHFTFAILLWEEFEDTKGVFRRRTDNAMAKWKNTKGQKKNDLQNIHFCTYKTKDRVTRNPLKTGGEIRCSGRVISSCSTNDTRRVNLVTNPVISHLLGKEREVLTTSCATFFDLHLSDYHVYPPKVSFNFYLVSAICRLIIGVFNIFVFSRSCIETIH